MKCTVLVTGYANGGFHTTVLLNRDSLIALMGHLKSIQMEHGEVRGNLIQHEYQKVTI